MSPDGKSVYVVASDVSDAVVRLNRNPTTGAVTQPGGSAAGGCISDTGAGPCADGHGLDTRQLGRGQPGRQERLRRLARQQRRGAPQPQYDHRSDQPAGRDRRLHRRAAARPGAEPCADGHGFNTANDVAVSADGKSVYVASSDSNAVVRLNRNPTTGAISQPAGSAGCISQPGLPEPCADGHGLDGVNTWRSAPDGKSVYVASRNAVVRLTRNTTTGAIGQPAGSAGCISQPGLARSPAPTATGSTARGGWR